MRIAVDAMGGDHAPEEIVPGAVARPEQLLLRYAWLVTRSNSVGCSKPTSRA